MTAPHVAEVDRLWALGARKATIAKAEGEIRLLHAADPACGCRPSLGLHECRYTGLLDAFEAFRKGEP